MRLFSHQMRRTFSRYPLRLATLLLYLLIVIGAGVFHAHDGDAVAGYDSHCLSCQWSHHAPTEIGGGRPTLCALLPAGILPVCEPSPSKYDLFSKLHGRSPPTSLS